MEEMILGQTPRAVQDPERSVHVQSRSTFSLSRSVILSLAVFVLSFAVLFAGPALALRLMAGAVQIGGPEAGDGLGSSGVLTALGLSDVVLQQGKSPVIDGNPVGAVYTGTRDTYINRWIPDKNFGNESRLMLGQSSAYRPLVYFDLAPASIPTTARVVTAQLGLYCFARNLFLPMEARVYSIVRPWDPIQANWTYATAASLWAIEGCDHQVTDRMATPVVTRSVFDRLVFQYFDVTASAQQWVTNPATNQGMLLVGPDPNVIYYYSSSRSTTVNQRPKLIITWTLDAATPTPTATPTTSPTPGPSPTPTKTPVSSPVLVDNTSLCFTYTPASGVWQAATDGGGYGGDFYYAPDGSVGAARWAPCSAAPLPVDGMYQVEAHWSVHSARPVAAPYLIKYDGGSATVYVDQTKNADGVAVTDFSPSGWFSLGVYPFLNGALSTTQFVELNTSSPGVTCADAVRFVPASDVAGPPYTVSMAAVPTTLPSDGAATTTLFITVTDRYGRMVNDGTMVGLTTSLGTLAYTYTEAESSEVTKLGSWVDTADAAASGGHYLLSSTTGDEVAWSFQGPAVSLVYETSASGGLANVSVDGNYIMTVSFASPGLTYKVERLLTSGLTPGVHTLRIRNIGVGDILLDALRSGVRTTGGLAQTTLIAPTSIGTATVQAVAIEPVVSRLSTAWPVTFTTVAFPGPDDVWVNGNYCSTCANDGHRWNYDAFKTIQAGVDKVLSGGTVHVANGVYTESVTISKPLTVQGVGGHSSVLNGVSDTPGSRGFYLDGVDDVTIEGFTIQHFETGIYLHGIGANPVYRATIINNRFESNSSGPASYALRGSDIYNSTFCSNDMTLGYNGIYLQGAYNTTICYNHVYNNQGFGIKLDVGNNNSIDNNTIHDNQNLGIELSGNTVDNAVYSNVLHDLWWDGILVNGTGLSVAHIGSNVISRTNLVWLNASSVSPDANHNLGGIVLIGATNSDITDNRVFGVSNAQGHRVDAAGIYLDSDSAPIDIAINLVQNCTGHGIHIAAAGGLADIHGNSIYRNGRFGLSNIVAGNLHAEGNWWGRNVPTGGPAEPADIRTLATVFWSPPISVSLAAGPVSIPANGVATSTITATAMGGAPAFGGLFNILDGTLITFTSDLSTALIPSSGAFGAGQMNTILRAGTMAGMATVTGKADPGIEGATTTVTLTALSPVSVTLRADPLSVVVESQSFVTATVLDVHGNAVPNQTVAFASSALGAIAPFTDTTDAVGEASTKFTAGPTRGTGVVTATVGGALTTSLSIPITAGPVCTGSMSIAAIPSGILANGVATSTIQVDMNDCHGYPVVDGTMVRFTTTLGSIVDLQQVEAESSAVTRSPEWSILPDATASGGQYVSTSTPGAALFWDFRGGAVSLTYWRSGLGGVMRVRIDGGMPFEVSTLGANAWVERVMASGLDPAVLHRIEITYVSGLLELDAFRSGASSIGGRASAILRAPVLAVTNTATVSATARLGDPLWPVLTMTTSVVLSQTNVVWVDDDYCPTCANDGHYWGNDAFSNIPDGVAAVRRPGNVMVATGTYSLPVNIITGSVNLIGADAALTKVDGTGLPTPAFTITGVSDVVIRNFTFVNWATGINIPGPAAGLEISNNVFTNCNTLAISGVRVSSSLFANNTIQHSDGGGIELDTLSGVTLRDNRIRDISGTGLHIFSSIAVPCIANQISYNIIERLGASGISVGASCSSTLVLSNTVDSTNRSTTGGGIVLDSTTDSTVDYNVVMQVSNAGASTDTAGIRVEGTNDRGEIRYNRVIANVNDGITLRFNTPPTVTCNHIYGNGNYGLVNNFGTPVEARGNWWGTNAPTIGPPAPADVGVIVPGNVVWDPPMRLTLTPALTSTSVGGLPFAVTAAGSGWTCNILDGMAITLSTSLGGLGSPPTSTVHMVMNGGQAVAQFTPGTRSGLAIITATISNAGVVTTSVEIKPGDPSSILLLADPMQIEVGTGSSSQSALSAWVYDMYGNTVRDGTSVYWSTLLGSVTPTVSSTTGGLAQSMLYAGTLPGTARVTAAWGYVVDTVDVGIRAGPPFAIASLVADPTAILCNGVDTSQITAIVRDQYGNLVPDGSMVTFYTTAGSMLYSIAEAESASVVHSGWSVVPDATASGGLYITSSTVGAEISWVFTGEAVSVGYWRNAGGGKMHLRVMDGGTLVTESDIDTSGSNAWTETVVANDLDPGATHRLLATITSGSIILDYLRSGATTVGGQAIATLTSGTVPTTAHVYVTGIGGTFPSAMVDVQFLEPLDVWVDDNWLPTSSTGHQWGFDAFSNIPAAVARVRSGGTVHVADGTYTMTVEITKPLYLDGSGSASTSFLVGTGTGNGIHVTQTADGTTIEGFAISSFQNGIYLDGTSGDYLDGVTVTNMVIRKCQTGGAIKAIYVNNAYVADSALYDDNGFGFDLNTGNNNRVTNNHIYDNKGFGVRVYSAAAVSDNNEVTDNFVYDLAWDGIRIGLGSTNTRVLTNTVHNTNRTWSPSGQFDNGGIVLYATINTRVEDNTVFDVQNGGGTLPNTAGVALDGGNNSPLILNNRILGNSNHGIWIDTDGYSDAAWPEVHGNSIYGNGQFGILNSHVGTAVNAEGNWWGRNIPTYSATAPADVFSGWGANVDYAPPIQLILTRAPTEIVADGISTAVITATMRSSGPVYSVVSGTQVTFTTSLGSLGAPYVVRTLYDGETTLILQSDTVSGRAYITGTTPSAGMDWTWVDFIAGPPATIAITGTPASIWAWNCSPGQPGQSIIVITVTDQYGNPCAGQAASFSVSPGVGASLSLSAGTLDVNGRLTTTLSSGDIATTVLVTATAGTVSRAAPIEVMSGQPADVTIERSPAAIAADGVSTALITVTVRDACHAPTPNLIRDGTMVGLVSSHGSLLYAYVETEAALSSIQLSAPSEWASVANPNASGGTYLHTTHSGAWITWQFTGTAVSLVYSRNTLGGQARVYVDGVLCKILPTVGGPPDEWQRETVIATDLTLGPHTLKVEASTLTPGQSISVDAFRSGTTTSHGVAIALLTSEPLSCTAYITATVVDTRIEAFSNPPQNYTTVQFEPANLVITKVANTATLPSGAFVDYTLTYTNTGLGTATNTLITDTLPISLTYVNSVSSPNLGPPTSPITNVWVWNAGNVPANGGGVITLIARRVCAPGLGVVTNTVDIGSRTTEVSLDPSLSNNRATAAVTLVPAQPFTVTLVAAPPNVRTNDFTSIQITVTDGCGDPVPTATVYLTTSMGGFDVTATLTNTTTTTDLNGRASVSFWGGPACGIATIDGSAGTAHATPLHVPVTSGPPAHSVVLGVPSSIPADGVSTSLITARVEDTGFCPVPDGFFVGFTTTAGSMLYHYDEENAPGVHTLGSWSTSVNPLASGGSYIYAYEDGAAVYWDFAGNGVSVIYLQDTGGGLVDVDIDGVSYGSFSMNSITTTVYQTEKVFTWSGNASDSHRIYVRHRPGTGPVFVDAFRSGATSQAGRAQALLTAANAPMTATVTAVGIEETGGIPVRVPGQTNVVFGAADLVITKTVQPTGQITIGQRITFTLNYRNTGPMTATNAYVDDVLSSDALRNPFFSPLPSAETPYTHYVWQLGDVAPGQSGMIVWGGTVDTGRSWPSWTALTNTAVISTSAFDMDLTNNYSEASIVIVPERPASISLSTTPNSISVGGSTSVLLATVLDMYGNPVPNGTVVTFTTTLGGFPSSAQYVTTTISGIATANLVSGPGVGTAHVVAQVNSLSASANVEFTPLPPFNMTLIASPTAILVGGETSAIDAYVTDQYGNWVADGTWISFSTSAGGIAPAAVSTFNGHASTTLTSGELATTATVQATAAPISGTVQVVFRPGEPIISMVARPTDPQVGQTTAITLCAHDRFNNVLSNEVVTFSTSLGSFGGTVAVTSTTNHHGCASAGLTSLVVGPAVVNGRIRTESDTIIVNFGPGDPYSIRFLSVEPELIPSCGGTALARVEVKDRYGNVVRDGTVVVFDVSPQGDVRPVDGGRTTNGVAQAIVSAGTVAGPATLWAWPENWRSQVVAQYSIVFLVGPPHDMTLTANPISLPVGGNRAKIQVYVTDCDGKPVEDTTAVTFTLTSGEGTLTPQYTRTTNGNAYADLTSPGETGSATISAQVGDLQRTVSVEYVPGPAAVIDLTAVPQRLYADGVSTATICAEIKDRWGNHLPDRTEVSFSTTLGRFETGKSFVGKIVAGKACVILTAENIDGTARVSARCQGVWQDVYITFMMAPTPTPTPTPRWSIRLPIIMKNLYR